MNKKSPAFYGVLASLALIASYVESLVPLPVPVPGIRLGLANAVVLACWNSSAFGRLSWCLWFGFCFPASFLEIFPVFFTVWGEGF